MNWFLFVFLSILGLVWYHLGLLVLAGVLVFLLGLFLLLMAAVAVLDEDSYIEGSCVVEEARWLGSLGSLCLVLGPLLPFFPDSAGAGFVSLLLFAYIRFPLPPSQLEVRFRS